MSRPERVDPAPHLRTVARVADAGGPRGFSRGAGPALASRSRHKLFTAMAYHDATGESARVYTNQPVAYRWADARR